MDFDAERALMVFRQIEARGITDPRVLAAMRTLPRECFVPKEERAWAYADHPLPIGHGQTISQPYIVAFTLEALGLVGTERILEIGAGSGYEAALLGMLGAEVWSLERIPKLAAEAASRLASLGFSTVHVIEADGFAGLSAEAPFDAIVLSAAPAEFPGILLGQLAEGGRLVGPMGRPGEQRLLRIRNSLGAWERESLLDVAFVPMLPGIARLPKET